MFREWSGSTRAEGTERLEKSGVFKGFFVPLKGFASVASRGEKSEKHRFGKRRLEPLGKTVLGHPLNHIVAESYNDPARHL